ncbi:hypothetical protein CL6EHI_002220 [Entamoeba histolytica]|uniref:Uncharacterized protein n=4 Tax=Entamoeba histolytica TaxID=5759 RepID=C4M824_ENTH1|nr:hypothetical protein EHI_002220 [Entamoeba histolytica HM-1:IMSS]EAL45454.2 hypothetical protein EHI_002220 [Entamoeba histolytica HM-1:IMSS]GAT97713.1 hypothetical protein CL6EHI_002220 [Entamoeba histolytica]|eukprot:XP_650841.2 hypothetical protein EHI_002220 [Entamoeba histolytica HM-1:IMSS]
MQSTITEITEDLLPQQTGLVTTAQTKSLDTQIVKKKRMNYIKFDGTSTLPYSPTYGATNVQMYGITIQDSYYFDPILFGYFFTANGIEVSDKLTIGQPHRPTDVYASAWDFYGLHASPIISGMGHFEITFYTKFKQLKNK